ncbi:zinc ribbon domain-containing protein [Nocardioides sp. AE5]|uniref:zinc ribbon domain-containing protein n=1 Tax=Nocardioides sp. AE5 TaxID=2962573 RepID=UPI002881A141|nr:zinc ribbon domain-containing protein [Nocardioides sp. AE5]MDT0202847.1 zinc ribbon domain-containing protein [Nocardioides sp. AE5]
MNTPACPNCGNPLDASMTACPRCGMPLTGGAPGQGAPTQQFPAQGGPVQGAQAQQYGAPGAAAPYATDQFGNPVPPGQPEDEKRKPWLIPLIVALAVLLIAGIAVAVFLLTRGDDDDTKTGTEEPSTGQSGEPSGDPTDGEPTDDPTDEPTDEPTDPPTTEEPTDPPTTDGPTDPPTNGGTMDRRTAPSGSDEAQLKQLESDLNAWFTEIYSGNAAACEDMGQFFLEADADSIQDCKESIEFVDGQTVTFEMTNIKVSGNTATVTMNTTVAGETNSSDDVKLVKRDGYWLYEED